MLKVIRSNKRFVLAGLMILSMMTFVVNRGNGNGNNSTDHEFATIGGKTVYSSELAESKAELNAVRANLAHAAEIPPISRFLGKPEIFFLLRHEARQLGIQVDNDEVMTAMVKGAPDLKPDNDDYELTREGIADIIRILMRSQQASSAIKASKPLVDRELVNENETIQANIVQISAQDYVSKVHAPTTQALQDQFNQFADSPPNHPVPTTNPFGFGYKLPLRAKVDYLRLTPASAVAAVAATKSAYDWEVAANKYYLLNSSEFIPKPATTASVTTAQIAPPLLVVHDQVLAKIRQPLVTSLMDQVQSFVSTTLIADYQAYSKSIGSAEPDSSLGVKFSSFTYLSKLLEKVQTKFNVTLLIGASPEYLSPEQIGAIPGVGTAALTEYVEKQAEAYLKDVEAKTPTADASLCRPSPPLVQAGNDNSVVFARMISALPSTKPASIDLVQSKVQADVIFLQAYKLAQAEAAVELTAAKAGTLLVAARVAGHSVLTLDSDSALSMSSSDVKGLFPPLGDSARSFMDQIFTSLDSYDPKTNPHPAQTIELPEQKRVFVSQVTFVNATWNAESYFNSVFSAQQAAVSQEKQAFTYIWLDYDSIVKRLDYQTTKSKKN